MNLYLIRYDLDEAVFLVKANTKKEAVKTWLKDRKEAGCEDLNVRMVSVVEQVFQGKVSQLEEI